jgi:glutamine---fructose-6-phosphate transaminase (isomerizing)
MLNSSSVIQGGYFRDILDQPAAVERTADQLEESTALAALGERVRAGAYRQVVLTGMGSSFHAFHPLLIELTGNCLPAAMVETSELIHYQARLLRPDVVTVALSQSGRSAEIVRLLELNGRRSFLVGVTNDASSPLAEAADALLLTHAGAEFSVSSKTYLASLVALEWLGGRLLGRDPAVLRGELGALPAAVSEYLADWSRHVDEALDMLAGVRHLFLVGRGPSLASAGTGGLIVKESTHFHAEGMSAAAFRHGPLEMVAAGARLVVFEGGERTAGLNARLAEDVISAGGRAAVVRTSCETGAFRVPPVPQRFLPVLEILPVEILTLALAAMDNHEAGAFGLASKVTLSE